MKFLATALAATVLAASCASTTQLPSQAENASAPSLNGSTLPKNTFEAQAVFDRVRGSVRAALCPKDQRMFDSIAFRFPQDANVEHVLAGRTADGRRVVEMSSGFLSFSSMIVQAIAYSAMNADSTGDGFLWTDYVSYLSSSLRNRADPVSPTMVAVRVLPYYAWAGITEERFARFLNDNQDGLKSLLLDAFVYALLHEVGHHILNHPPTSSVSSERSRQQEWEADLYAISGIARLRQSSLGAIPYYLFSTEFQGAVEEPTGSHDPAICRVHYLLFDKNSSSNAIARLRGLGAEACGRQIAHMDAAFDSTDRAVCYRPPSSPK